MARTGGLVRSICELNPHRSVQSASSAFYFSVYSYFGCSRADSLSQHSRGYANQRRYNQAQPIGQPRQQDRRHACSQHARRTGRLRSLGATMPMKVTISAKSNPQLAGLGSVCPAKMPIQVHRFQLTYMKTAEPRKNQCLYGEASGWR
jgi:hypothetical protein